MLMFKLKSVVMAAITAFPMIGCDSPDSTERGMAEYQLLLNQEPMDLAIELTSDGADGERIAFFARLGEREFDVSIGPDESTVTEADIVLIRIERTDIGLLATNEHGESVAVSEGEQFAAHIEAFDAEAAFMLDGAVINEFILGAEVTKRWLGVAIGLVLTFCRVGGSIGSEGWSIEASCGLG